MTDTKFYLAERNRALKVFIAERNDALKNLDRAKIIAYLKKYGEAIPENESVFWAAVHKARLLIRDFSDAEKEVSRQWLKDHGFREESF